MSTPKDVFDVHLPVGVFIAVLALLGVVVPLLREKIGKWEKALWTSLMFTLLLLELNSIRVDHHDQEVTRDQQNERFSKIAEGLKTSLAQSEQ